MLKYGHFLEDYDQNDNEARTLIAEYYNNPVMTKVKIHGTEEFWAAKVPSMMFNSYRYIIAITPISNSKDRATKFLIDIPWTSFQTRTIKENWNLGTMNYEPRHNKKFALPIKRVSVEDEISYYVCDSLPGVTVLLLPQRESIVQYPDTGSVSRALETFHTIIALS